MRKKMLGFGHKLFLLILLCSFTVLLNARILINEIVPSNLTYVVENDIPDSWIELYNNEEGPIYLWGYRIGLSSDFDSAWSLQGEYEADSYILICCDKESRSNHTNFKLDYDGGSVYLFSPDGEIVDILPYPAQTRQDMSFGMQASNKKYGYFCKPTPLAANGDLCDFVLPAPSLSASYSDNEGGYLLKISIPDAIDQRYAKQARICLSFDGSEPTENSYSVKAIDTLLATTTTVRAKIVSENCIGSDIVSRSFILHNREQSLPIVSIMTDSAYLYDDNIGIIKNYTTQWRRPINFEYFDMDGTCRINQLCEVGVHGGSTKVHPQKSLALYANKRFGTKRFKYAFFDAKESVDKNKSILLRNSGNQFNRNHITDAFLQTLFGSNVENLDWQAYQPVIAYINGKYAGIYDLRERSNEDYVWGNYNGLEDFDMIKDWDKVQSGNVNNYNKFVELYSDAESTYKEMSEVMDVDEFLNFFIANFYGFNSDFPYVNIVQWAPTNGKWRWILKDMDCSSFCYDNYFDYIYRRGKYENTDSNSERSVKLFQKMLSFEEFKESFVNKSVAYLGDFLQKKYSIALLDSLVNDIALEMPYFQDVYKEQISFKNWDQEIGYMRDCLNDRAINVYKDTQKEFSLGEMIPVTINHQNMPIEINGVKLKKDDFNGYFYADRETYIEFKSDCHVMVCAMETTWITEDGVEIRQDTVKTNVLKILPSSDMKSLSIDIKYVEKNVSIFALSNNEKMGYTTGSDMYELCANDTVTIVAVPFEKHEFVKWNDGSIDNPRIVEPICDTSYIAVFQKMPYIQTSFDADRGYVDGMGFYNTGTNCTLKAYPNLGYKFVRWDDGDTENPRTVNVLSDITYTAIFDMETYSINVYSNDNKMGEVNGSGTYLYDELATITAIPNDKYSFITWDDGVTENPRTIVVNENAEYVAIFQEDLLTIYAVERKIVVEHADKEIIIYDSLGREVVRGYEKEFPMSSAGVYFIKIGTLVTRIVVT